MFNLAFHFRLHPRVLRLRRNDNFGYIPEGRIAVQREGVKHIF